MHFHWYVIHVCIKSSASVSISCTIKCVRSMFMKHIYTCAPTPKLVYTLCLWINHYYLYVGFFATTLYVGGGTAYI